MGEVSDDDGDGNALAVALQLLSEPGVAAGLRKLVEQSLLDAGDDAAWERLTNMQLLMDHDVCQALEALADPPAPSPELCTSRGGAGGCAGSLHAGAAAAASDDSRCETRALSSLASPASCRLLGRCRGTRSSAPGPSPRPILGTEPRRLGAARAGPRAGRGRGVGFAGVRARPARRECGARGARLLPLEPSRGARRLPGTGSLINDSPPSTRRGGARTPPSTCVLRVRVCCVLQYADASG